MGRNALRKVDWAAAAKNALREEGDNWDDWKVRSALRRMGLFKSLERIQGLQRFTEEYRRAEYRRAEKEYFASVYKVDFGPSKVILGVTARKVPLPGYESMNNSLP